MPAAAPVARLRAARPTLRIDGQDAPTVAAMLLSLSVAEDAGGLYRCEARVANWGERGGQAGFLWFDRRALDFGKRLEVRYGDGTLFDGRITALEARYPPDGPAELAVLAEDRLQDLRMTRRTLTYENVTDADLVTQVASRHGLTPDVDLDGGAAHAVVAQVNQSDLALLRDRARGIDAEVWVEATILHAQARARRNAGTVSLEYQRDLRAFTALADLAHQRTTVHVGGWDVQAKAALACDATAAVLGAELQGQDSGASILSAALGARDETIAHAVPLTRAEAQARADAAFKAGARRFVVGRGVAETDPRLRVGAVVDLARLGPLFDGKYFVSEVEHVFDESGIRTEFTAERPGLGRP